MMTPTRSHMMRCAIVTGYAFALLVAGAASASNETGSLQGRVEVRLRSAPRNRPNVNALGESNRRARANRTRSVVYLETAPRGAFEPNRQARAVLDQQDETFLPFVLAIQSGTVVDFPNSDDIFHNVFSLSKPRRFDLGRYPQGKTKSVRFEEPGIVRVFCEIHSHMSAFILVFSHRFFAATDEDGNYRIDDIPSGSYKVVVWTDGEIRRTVPVDIVSGQVVPLDVVVE